MKYTQRKPHYVDSPAHGLPTVMPMGFVPVDTDVSGVRLAKAEEGSWCTAVAVDTSNPNRVGLMYDGVIFTPDTPLAVRKTLFVSTTAGEITTTQEDSYQAIGEVQDAHNTLIRIHAPVGEADNGLIEDTTDGQLLEWGKQYWLHPAFNYTFPAVTQTANDNWMRGYPSNFDWRAFTGTWTANGTDTLGAGQQPLAALSDAVTFIGSLGTPSNISMHVGGGSAAEVGLPAFDTLTQAQAAGIAGRLFRGTGAGVGGDFLIEGAYFMDATNTPVGPFS